MGEPVNRTVLGAALILAAANFASAQVISRSMPGQLRLAEATGRPERQNQEKRDNDLKPFSDPSQTDVYHPITGKERLQWFLVGTVGPKSLAGGAVASAYSTATNNPYEYGPGWSGFVKRYGMRLTGVATGNLMEVSLGALWGEDPRYFRAPGESFGRRVKNVIKLTFVTRRRDGGYRPAYARFLAVPGNNFLSNTWRVDSESRTQDALVRTLEGFLGQMASNAFGEFWPDVKARVFHRKH